MPSPLLVEMLIVIDDRVTRYLHIKRLVQPTRESIEYFWFLLE